MSETPRRGFVYAVTGEKYIREAALSAESLRTFHPNSPIILMTDE